MLAELAGPAVSARSIRRDVIAMAPERIGPEVTDVPVLLLDGTGERAGNAKGGVALHLAIGLVARRREGSRMCVEACLLGATVAEPWSVMDDLLAGVRPGLVLVDGEEELSALAAERFAGVPVQRCLWHLGRGVYRAARYTDRASHELSDDFRRQLEVLLLAAYRNADLAAAQGAYADLIDDAEGCGAWAAAAHLRAAEGQVFTFLTHPDAGRLVFGDKGRAELGTGAGAGHAGDEPPHRRGRALVGPRRAGHPHGQAPAQVRSRPVVTSPGGRSTPSSAVQSRGVRPVSTLRLATE